MASPKLRFKEFDEDWSDSKLGQLIGISSASRVFKEQWQTSGVPFFRTSDVVSISKNKENEKAYISLELFEELSKKSGKIQKGDLLVTGGGTIGIPYLVKNDEPLYFKDADLLWMKSSGIIDGSFLYNFFISPKFREYLKSISHTGTISHFTIEQAKVTPFQYPSKEEQTKIATFLSAVDEKISQLSQKLHLLVQYKQGMMQKLFSQQLRFKADDGSEFGEWSNKTIGDVANIKRGASPRPINDSKWFDDSSSIGWVRISDVSKSKKYLLQTEQYLSTLGIQKSRLVPKGNLIMSICATIGKPIYTGFDVCIHDGFVVFSELQAIHEYAYYYLEYIEKNWYQYGQPGTQVNLNSDIVSNEAFPFPCLEEQTKIANFLSAIDQKIDVVSEQLEQAKLWKKGLLQQMFV